MTPCVVTKKAPRCWRGAFCCDELLGVDLRVVVSVPDPVDVFGAWAGAGDGGAGFALRSLWSLWSLCAGDSFEASWSVLPAEYSFGGEGGHEVGGDADGGCGDDDVQCVHGVRFCSSGVSGGAQLRPLL